MNSIKNISTEGMDLTERYNILSLYKPVPLGEIVFRAGGAWGYPEEIKVSSENQQMVTMFWNSLYFDNYLSAEKKTVIAHAEYSNWQANAMNY